MALSLVELTLAIVVGSLAAIIYVLRIMVLMEKRVRNIENHIEKLVKKVLSEDIKIERMIKRKK